MIKYINGDALEIKTDYLAHQVNTLGIMGGGIALAIRNKYPEVYMKYKELCDYYQDQSETLIGSFLPVNVDNSNLIILNCFSQKGLSRTERTTDYNAIKEIFQNIKDYMPKGKVLTIPYKYGCGLANGDWDIVKSIMEDIFEDSDIVLQIVRKD